MTARRKAALFLLIGRRPIRCLPLFKRALLALFILTLLRARRLIVLGDDALDALAFGVR